MKLELKYFEVAEIIKSWTFLLKVVYREIDTSNRVAMREWGLSDGLFVNKRNIYKGLPLSYEKIKKIIR